MRNKNKSKQSLSFLISQDARITAAIKTGHAAWPRETEQKVNKIDVINYLFIRT